ncbi:zinc finger MYM-type protein 1-like [Zingiber officinale]|uniref:zinc finger MYM-type protein 1-like n=1 Tax=Zingiber officinale TaxID=94328 RepID=UPI001C4ABF23|nr:zinc finger MYM-type protein 1-like [Zingiber officinale]
MGTVNSCHNGARIQFEAFQDQRHSVGNILRVHSRDMEIDYRTRLTAMLDMTRFLLKQELPFRGHDESTSSSNRGNFLELLEWYSQRNEEVSKVIKQNAPANNQLTSPKIQKDLTRACASEITLAIINDIGDKFFSLMVDEAKDSSVKEHMRVVLRYVNKKGCVIERFLAVVHVPDTSSHSLKMAIDALFVQHGLSLSRLRGQGYDGASNMRVIEVLGNVYDDASYSANKSVAKLVETEKHLVFPLVYRMIELALVLPVATASVERVFSAMKTVKTDLRNRMGDEWMNDSLVVYIEKDIFSTIENEQILQHFQQMQSRRIQLPPLVLTTVADFCANPEMKLTYGRKVMENRSSIKWDKGKALEF